MNFKIDRCPKCGKDNLILPSNNPITPGVCFNCVVGALDYDSLLHADFFCRSYNIPFEPERWVKFAEHSKENVFKEYISWVADEYRDKTLYWDNPTGDLWKMVNDQWKYNRTHEELVAQIAPIKDGYLLRNKIKWGANYSFEELVSLENLYVNTLKANDISNPMQIDAIKKACKMSIMLDRSIVNEDAKEIRELSSAYQNFIKTAKIDEVIVAASKDVISNVAELADFIEKSGFVMPYYDNVERDVVDKSINDIKQYIRTLVSDAVGLETVFETINNALKVQDSKEADEQSFQKVSLEDLYGNAVSRQNQDFDEELEKEDIADVYDDYGDDEDDDEPKYFG